MNKKKLKTSISNIVPCVCYSTICGTITGCTIFLFKLGAKYAEELSRFLYQTAKSSVPGVLICILGSLALALVMSILHKKVPECKGGGIPRSEGILRGIFPFHWLKTLLGTFFGSMLSFLAGLPVGSEGPAVLIGTSLGKMSLLPFKNRSAWNRYIMTGGAGAGFAVATGAPLAGILFALEEIHKRISPILVLTVATAVSSATFANQLLCHIFRLSPVLFDIGTLPAFGLEHTAYLLLLGLLTAVSVALFDGSILLFRRFTSYSKKIGPIPFKLLTVFLLSGFLGLFFADGAYSGHHLILHILSHDMPVFLLLALFAIRLLMMLLITDSGATGGIFIPTLAIGALSSALIAKFLVLLGMPSELMVSVIFLGMCAFIGGTLRAPLSASVLFLELTGQFTGLSYVLLTVFVVNCFTELLHLTPFYDKALEEMTETYHHNKEAIISNFVLTVSDHAFVAGKAVRDIIWPYASVIVSITYANGHKIELDDGEQRLRAGDTILLRARYYDKERILYQLRSLVGTEHEITIE